MVQKIRIGNRWIGEGEPCFIIAEAGSNHDRKLTQAKRLIDIAAEAGADAVKFQTFQAEKIIAKTKDKASYLEKLTLKEETMYDIFKRLELPREWHRELFEYAVKRGIMFLSTPFDREAVDLLDELGVPAFKIASFELWDLPLIEYVASKNKPIILSTGMANLGDIEDALEVIYKTKNREVILLHCAISYPPLPEHLNLCAIKTLESAFGVPVGFSDHTLGINIPQVAVALGAKVIEKHFTVDKTLKTGPDHAFALSPIELAEMIKGIRETEKAMGSPIKQRTPGEEELYRLGRRSIFAKTDIPKGTVLTEDMLAILRPGIGLKPKYLEVVLGRRARCDIAANEPITWEKI